MKKMKDYIDVDVVSHLQYYFDKVYQSKGDLVLDGVLAFNEKSQFVEGKVINAFNYLYENSNNDQDLLEKLQDITRYAIEGKYETWGILNCITSLYRLKTNNLFDDVVTPDMLEKYIEKLDWRTFVNIEDLSLIDKPTNYYGVAFGIAKYRELLGFEPVKYSELLLNKLIKHIEMYSGPCCFMDETQGQGRFDRYSTLIPAELCAMLANTNCEIPDILLKMLRRSCDIYINLANSKGHGFTYGRSIGAYGDTAALEILSIAARLNVLTEEEKIIAYNYNIRIIDKFFHFWIDSETKSLNMWDKGRKTDGYRNKNRILGENLSLCMQIVGSFQNWKLAGFEDTEPIEHFTTYLETLKPFHYIQFSDSEFVRGMFIIRDREHVFSMPLISGGKQYYNETPYLPIPFEHLVLETSANTTLSNLIPMITLKDNTKVMPIVYYKDLRMQEDNDNNILSIDLTVESQCIIGDKVPHPYEGMSSAVSYRYEPGKITYKNVIQNPDHNIKELSMSFASFAPIEQLIGSEILFEKGIIKSITAEGFDKFSAKVIDNNTSFQTPHGKLISCIEWIKKVKEDQDTITIQWEIKYN